MSEPGLLARVWEKLHRWALRRATRVIVLGEDMRARIIAKGVDPAGIEIVRDGADIVSDAMRRNQRWTARVIRTIRGNFRFVLLHAGNLGFYGAWETLITAVRNLEADGVGWCSSEKERSAHTSKRWQEKRKTYAFFHFFPASKIPSVLAAADAHVITVKRGLEGVVVPSKMYGILAAGKPIIAVAPEETDAASLGAKFGFAVSADPDDPEKVAAAIRLLAMDERKFNPWDGPPKPLRPIMIESKNCRNL